MKKHLKMYLVKREVYARNIAEALTNKGTVYSVEIAADNYQPTTNKEIGFTDKAK